MSFELGRRRGTNVLIPPITVQQVQEFTPGSFPSDSNANNSNSGSNALQAVVSSAFQGVLPAFVLSDHTSYYGDLDPDTLLPDGLGVFCFKCDASRIGSSFDGTFSPPARGRDNSGISTKAQFEQAVKARSALLLPVTAGFSAGDRYGGFLRQGLAEGEGALLTSAFTYQGTFANGRPHGRGNMKYHKSYLDRMPVITTTSTSSSASGGAGGGSGIGSFLFRSLTSALLPFGSGSGEEDGYITVSTSSSGYMRPKEYIGEFDQRLLRHGFGMMKYANGDVYEGEWRFNRRDGQGKFIVTDSGEEYEGSWSRDERHGYGKVLYPDGTFFKGLFDHGQRSGEGILLFPNGDEYYGHFDRNRVQGEGTMKFKNGDLYSGSWKDGMRHGQGMYVLKKTNITVRGNFVNGLMEGQGVVEYPNTGIFIGDFERGERRTGTMFWFTAEEQQQQQRQRGKGNNNSSPTQTTASSAAAGGEVTEEAVSEAVADTPATSEKPAAAPRFVEDPRRCYQGEWVGENMHGKGLMWYKNGDFFSGHFVKNVRQGAGNMRYADAYSADGAGLASGGHPPAREYSGQFLADMRHGVGVEQSADGSVKAGRWESDVFVEGYEGEWDSETLNGVGRLRLCLATFFQNTDNSKPLPSILSTSTTSPPPIRMPSLLSFLSKSNENGTTNNNNNASINGADGALTVFAHPAQGDGYERAKAAWMAATKAAQEINDLYMVEFFGIFKNGRRHGTGVLRLPYTCERLPVPAPCKKSSQPTEKETKKRLAFARGKGTSGKAKTAEQQRGEHQDPSQPPLQQQQQQQPQALPPSPLLLRRHVIKGKWESNVLDCDRAVWAFPNGQTYVGAMAGNARHEPLSQQPTAGRQQQGEGKPQQAATGSVLYFPDGSVFIGHWRHGAPHGRGVFLCKDTQSPVYERQVERLGVGGRNGGSAGGDNANGNNNNNSSSSQQLRTPCKTEKDIGESMEAHHAAAGAVASTPPSSSASRRRRELRASLTRRGMDGGEEEVVEKTSPREVPASTITTTTTATATAAASTGPPLAALGENGAQDPHAERTKTKKRGRRSTAENPSSGFFGIDFIINLFVGADDSGNTSEGDDNGNDNAEDDAGARTRGVESAQRERVRKVFTGFEDAFYLFGQWTQETDASVVHSSGSNSSSPLAKAGASSLTMPFAEYTKKVAARLPVVPVSHRALAYEGTSMAEAAIGFRPPPRRVARHLSSAYALQQEEGNNKTSGGSGSGAGNSSLDGRGEDDGGEEEAAQADEQGKTIGNGLQRDEFYATLLPVEGVPRGTTLPLPALHGCPSSPTSAATAAAKNALASAKMPMQRPAPPDALNISRVSGQGIYVFPATGVCVQAFFLDNMPRLAVPYRPGSAFDHYLFTLKYHQLGGLLADASSPSFSFDVPSQCSDYSYLLNHLRCLRRREEFLPPSSLVSPSDEQGQGETHASLRDSGHEATSSEADPFSRGLGISNAYVPGSTSIYSTSHYHHQQQQRGTDNDLVKPEPLDVCTICKKAYSFFREASCCTLCYRSCCSSCLNDYEILNKTGASSSTTAATAAANASGSGGSSNNNNSSGGGGAGVGGSGGGAAYSEVSALLASSYFLLQKLRKGAEVFAEDEERESGRGSRRADQGTQTREASPPASFEITSRQLLTLLSGQAALPVCADCVRCILMRVERQTQWIPLKLFSSVVKFEHEDNLEDAQAHLARRRQKRMQRRSAKKKKGGVPSDEEMAAESCRRCGSGPDAEEEAMVGQWGTEEEEELPPANADSDNDTAGDRVGRGRRGAAEDAQGLATPPRASLVSTGSTACDSALAAAAILAPSSPPPIPPSPSSGEDVLQPQQQPADAGTPKVTTAAPSPPPFPRHTRNSSSSTTTTATANERSMADGEEDHDSGYAIYRGYTSHSMPHLFGELWWWPAASSRGKDGHHPTSTATPGAYTDLRSPSRAERRGGAGGGRPYELLGTIHACDDEDEDNSSSNDEEEEGGKDIATGSPGSRSTRLTRVRDYAGNLAYLPTRVLALDIRSSGRSRRQRRRADRQERGHVATPTARIRLTVINRGAPAVVDSHSSLLLRHRRSTRDKKDDNTSDSQTVVSHHRRGQRLRQPQQRYYYVGSFSAGKRCGHGTVLFENGEKFIGFFKDNAMHGEGYYFCDDGAVVHGVWKRDTLSLVLYIGEVEDDNGGGEGGGGGGATHRMRRSGRGICFYDNVRQTRSLFFRAEESALHDATAVPGGGGKGEKRVAGEETGLAGQGAQADAATPSLFRVYNGQWRKGQKHGSGVLFMRGGVTYSGCFRHDRMHGHGQLTTPSSLFSGAFRHNTKDGYGMEFFFDVNRHHSSSSSRGTHSQQQQRQKKAETSTQEHFANAFLSSVVEGQWRKDVSDGFVRIYSRRGTGQQRAGATSPTPSPSPPPRQEAEEDNNAAHNTSSSSNSREEVELFDITETTYCNGNERDDCFAAPVMKSDEESSECALCKKAFHLFLRRHHCRLCGEVTCDSCSQRRARLPDHFYITEEEKSAFQRGTREAAFKAVAATSSAFRTGGQDNGTSSTSTSTNTGEHTRRGGVPGTILPSGWPGGQQTGSAHAGNPDSGDDDSDREPGEEVSGKGTGQPEGGREGGSNKSPLPNRPPQRVCDLCYYRLEQRRALVVRKYADGSVYCGCVSTGRWVSRGLYWRADGVFFVFDEQGKLLQRQQMGDGGTAPPALVDDGSNAAAGSGHKGLVLSSSVLQDASLSKEYMDSHPVLFSESSPTTELDKFLLWWVMMNTRCQLSLATLDFPQLRAYKLLFSRSRTHTTITTVSPASGSQAVVLAGSPEARTLSVANLLPTLAVAFAAAATTAAPSTSTAVRTSQEEARASDKDEKGEEGYAKRQQQQQQQQQRSSLTIDGAALRVAHDFKRWLYFPQPPPALATTRFISYSDAVRLQLARARVAGTAAGQPHSEMPDPNVEAALLRAARHHPCVLPRPPPFPFGQSQRTNRQRDEDADEAQEGQRGGCPLLPLCHRPPPLAAVDMTDEELLKEVTRERVENFLAFAPPSQLQDDDDNTAEEGSGRGDKDKKRKQQQQQLHRNSSNHDVSNTEDEMKILACYRYQHLFPATPALPTFGEHTPAAWTHWHTHSIPVYNPTKLPLTRRSGSTHGAREIDDSKAKPALGASGAVLDENQLYYACPFAPVTVGRVNDSVEQGKIKKVAMLMLSREARQARRLRRRKRLQERLEKHEGSSHHPRPRHRLRRSDKDSSSSRAFSDNSSSSSDRGSSSDDEDEDGDGDWESDKEREREGEGQEKPRGIFTDAEIVDGLMTSDIFPAPMAGKTKKEKKERKGRGGLAGVAGSGQLVTLFDMGHADKGWLPERFDGPFKFSLHCDGI